VIAEAQPHCRIPDDCIDKNRYSLFMARYVLRPLYLSLQAITFTRREIKQFAIGFCDQHTEQVMRRSNARCSGC